jgi:hypothetical protein
MMCEFSQGNDQPSSRLCHAYFSSSAVSMLKGQASSPAHHPTIPRQVLILDDPLMFKLAVLAQLAGVAFGAVGPSASLYIGNAVISPDGYDRS